MNQAAILNQTAMLKNAGLWLFRGEGLGAAGVQTLVPILGSVCIAELNLRDNDLGSSGGAVLGTVLGSSKHMLTSVNLQGNELGDSPWGPHCDQAVPLASALIGSRIVSLNLQDNSLGERFAAALAAVLQHTRIRELNLALNSLGEAGLKLLSPALPQSSITSLDLMGNDLGAAGAAALGAGLIGSKVCTLLYVTVPYYTSLYRYLYYSTVTSL